MSQQNSLIYLIGGLVLGLIVGLLAASLVAGDDDDDDSALDEATVRQIVAEQNTQLQAELSTLIEGAVQPQFNTRDEPLNAEYFLVPFTDTETWLEGEEVEIGEEFATDFESILGIETAEDLGVYFAEIDQGGSVENVLSVIYQTLLDSTGSGELEAFAVCLGLDQDPYSISGPGLYLYLRVPEAISDDLPKEWELLNGPKEDSMLWSSECYAPDDEGAN